MDVAPIIIREVTDRFHLKKFIDFPVDLYRDNPYFTPAIFEDEMVNLSSKNPANEYCEFKLFLAYRQGKIVGRICAILNRFSNEKYKQKRIRFNRIDMVDDLAVTTALIGAVEAFGKSKGMEEIVGPLGYSDQDKEGLLTEGFDQKNMFVTFYTEAYYVRHLEALGFVKDVTWIEKRIAVPPKLDPKFSRLADLVSKRYGVHLVKLHSKRKSFIAPYVRQIFPLMNRAYDHLYGYVPIKENLMDMLVKQFLPIVNLDYIQLVVDQREKLVAFGLMIPSPVDALKKHRGHLFPFGWIDFFSSIKKAKVLDMLLIAVEPAMKNSGLLFLIFEDALKNAIRNGIKYCETGPELESNVDVQGLWKHFDHIDHKKRSCFIKKIAI